MAGQLFFLPFPTAFTSNGLPAGGAKLYFYEPGSLTPKDVFTNVGLTVAASFPVVANAAGHFSPIYLDDAETYRLIIKDKHGTTLDDVDDYQPGTIITGLGGGGGGGGSGTSADLIATRSLVAAVATPVAGDVVTLTESGRFGQFKCELAFSYTAAIAADTLKGVFIPSTDDATKVWVRQIDRAWNVMWFGADNTGVADSSAAMIALVAVLKVVAKNANAFYKGSARVYIPPGSYKWSNPVDITHTLIIEGDDTGSTAGHSTQLNGDASLPAFFRAQTTASTGQTGAQTEVPGVTFGGDCSIIQHIAFQGAWNGTTNGEGEYHGIVARSRVYVRHCSFYNLQGDGIKSFAGAGAGAPFEGQSSVSKVEHCSFIYCRNGVNLDGADSNVWGIQHNDFIYCRAWGISGSEFLGGNYRDNHFRDNGYVGASSTPSMTGFGGSWYTPVIGQTPGTDTNSPYGATATITIASPGVVTWTAHGLVAGKIVSFSTTGALPTGLVANTAYYVINPAANTFQLAASAGGAAINTSGSQSGVHTAGANVDNQWWLWVNMGAAPNTSPYNAPAWSSGAITYRAGGPYMTDNPNANTLCSGNYTEGYQGVRQLANRTMDTGGKHATRQVGGGALYGSSGAVATNLLRAESDANGYCSNSIQPGDVSGVLRRTLHTLYSPTGFFEFWFGGDLTLSDTYSLADGNNVYSISTAISTATHGPGRMNFPYGYGLGGKKIRPGTAAPVAGAWLVGDQIINTAPAAAGNIGWVCTTAGSPGVWKTFGVIAA